MSQFKRVVVKLHNIANVNTGEDPGSELEVFGRFDAGRVSFDPDLGEVVTLETVNLWNEDGDNSVGIEQGQALLLDRIAQFDMEEGEFLQISGHLGEQDDIGANDPLGSIDNKIQFNNLQSGQVDLPDFHEGDQIVRVKMSLQSTTLSG